MACDLLGWIESGYRGNRRRAECQAAQQRRQHFAADVGQAEVATLRAHRQLGVVDAELVQDGRVQVVHVLHGARVAERGERDPGEAQHERQLLDLYLAAGGSLAAATALPHYLTDRFGGGFDALQFVKRMQRLTGRTVLPFADPTPEELAAAARSLAR